MVVAMRRTLLLLLFVVVAQQAAAAAAAPIARDRHEAVPQGHDDPEQQRSLRAGPTSQLAGGPTVRSLVHSLVRHALLEHMQAAARKMDERIGAVRQRQVRPLLFIAYQ